MKSFRIMSSVVVVLLIALLSLSAVADAGKKHGHRKKFKALQAQIDANKTSIENIELTPGPQGPAGADGADGAQGPAGADGLAGADGADGDSIQGPQGEPGTSRWVDGVETVSTDGSVQIGSDTADGTDNCNAANAGTIRFNTDTNTFEGCNGTEWVSLSPIDGDGDIYAIGEDGPAGGKVFYITDGGLHGLEAAPVDQASGAWGCYGTTISGADGTAVGTGAQNTADILAGCSDAGTVAEIADAYTLGGYNDWFLPSKDELNELYLQKDVVGGFASDFYWSSSESNSYRAWTQVFTNGDQYDVNKGSALRVRAVRAF